MTVPPPPDLNAEKPPLADDAASAPLVAAHRRENRDAAWQRRANIAQTVLAVGTLAAVVVAAFTYVGSQESERAKQAISYIDLWETGGYQADWRRLRAEWNIFLDRVPGPQRDEVRNNPERRQRLVATFLDEQVGTPTRRDGSLSGNPMNVSSSSTEPSTSRKEALADLVYFFNRLHLCVKADLCSRRVIQTFFGQQVGSFHETFGPWLDVEAGDLSSSISEFHRNLN